jgi:heptosyltransferase-3
MRILFITATRIGDAVLSTGLLDYLVRTYPDAKVTVACGPEAAPLFMALPNLEKLIPMTKERWSMHWTRLWSSCATTYWDIVVDLRKSVVAYLLACGERHTFKRSNEAVHRVREIADVLDLPEPPMPRIWITAKEREKAASLLPADRPVLAVGPTTNWRAKTWRAANFIELIQRLTAPSGLLPHARVAVLGGPKERDQALPVLDALPADQRIDLVGNIDLLVAYACLKRCALYVGNDSALMHLAAASGIPTLGLFGPSQDVFYAPWGWHTEVARTRVPFDAIFPEKFDHRTSDSLMDSLTVDDAEAAARDLWRRVTGKAA